MTARRDPGLSPPRLSQPYQRRYAVPVSRRARKRHLTAARRAAPTATGTARITDTTRTMAHPPLHSDTHALSCKPARAQATQTIGRSSSARNPTTQPSPTSSGGSHQPEPCGTAFGPPRPSATPTDAASSESRTNAGAPPIDHVARPIVLDHRHKAAATPPPRPQRPNTPDGQPERPLSLLRQSDAAGVGSRFSSGARAAHRCRVARR